MENNVAVTREGFGSDIEITKDTKDRPYGVISGNDAVKMWFDS